MRPRLGALAAALVVPALPMLFAAPAQAASTICVSQSGQAPAGVACALPVETTIQAAINRSASGDTIRVNQGTYPESPVLPIGVNLRGNGAGTSATATVLSLPAGNQTYITADSTNTIADLRVNMVLGNGATGIRAGNATTVDNVVVFAANSTNSTGISVTGGATLRDATVNMTNSPTGTGVLSTGGNTLISQSTWNGGGSGYVLAAASDPAQDVVRQITVNGEGDAITVKRGVLNIDDSVLDLGTLGTTGLLADPDAGVTATIHAFNITIVRGKAGAKGAVVDSTGGGARTADISLLNSIVRTTGPSFDRIVGGGTATLSVNNSNFVGNLPAGATGANNLQDVDPQFVNPAGDYHLRGTSPVVDKGVTAPQAPADRDGNGRTDGNRNGIPEPDLGAYELKDFTPPVTTFTAGPSGFTNNRQPVFQFKSENGATFQCALDGGAFQPCTSPATTTVLPDGPHSFSVRATDAAFNVENPPVVRSFIVDGTAPQVTITKKPAKRFFKKRVKFKFSVNEPGATLQCSLDNSSFKPCAFKWKFNTKPGKHVLQVRAVDAAGNTGQTLKYKYKRFKRR